VKPSASFEELSYPPNANYGNFLGVCPWHPAGYHMCGARLDPGPVPEVPEPGVSLMLLAGVAVVACRMWARRIACATFALVYRRWLFDDWAGKPARVVRVLGWRTAIIDSSRGRSTMTACFCWLE